MSNKAINRKDIYGQELYEGDSIISAGYLLVPHSIVSTAKGFGVKGHDGAIHLITEAAWENAEKIGSLYGDLLATVGGDT